MVPDPSLAVAENPPAGLSLPPEISVVEHSLSRSEKLECELVFPIRIWLLKFVAKDKE